MAELAISFPDRRDWQYAVDKLRQAEWHSLPYLVKCLETACHRRGASPHLPAPYTAPADHSRDCVCERCWFFRVPQFLRSDRGPAEKR